MRTSAAVRQVINDDGGAKVSEAMPRRASRPASGSCDRAVPSDPGEKSTTGHGPPPAGCVQYPAVRPLPPSNVSGWRTTPSCVCAVPRRNASARPWSYEKDGAPASTAVAATAANNRTGS